MIKAIRTSIYFICLFFGFVGFVFAEEEEVSAPKAQYFDLRPSFVANFGDTTAKRLKFIKADISVRAFSNEAIAAVIDHDALVRHQVVMILSSQTEERLATSDGQESVRLDILAKVKAILKEETGKEQIDDLLFTSFVVQR